MTAAPRPTVSVTTVIVTYNNARDILSCLKSVADGAVVVVDNASTDGTPELIRDFFPQVTLIPLPVNLGLSKAFNVGWRTVREGDVLFLNPDAAVPDGGLEALQAHLRRFPSAGIVAPRLQGSDGSSQDSARTFPTVVSGLARRTPLGKTDWGRRVVSQHLAVPPTAGGGCVPVDWVLGAAMLIRRSMLERLGGLDEHYFLYCEDTDLCARVWQAGFQVIYCPQVTFRHRYQRQSSHTFDVRSRAVRAHWRSTLRLAKRYPAAYFRGQSVAAHDVELRAQAA